MFLFEPRGPKNLSLTERNVSGKCVPNVNLPPRTSNKVSFKKISLSYLSHWSRFLHFLIEDAHDYSMLTNFQKFLFSSKLLKKSKKFESKHLWQWALVRFECYPPTLYLELKRNKIPLQQLLKTHLQKDLVVAEGLRYHFTLMSYNHKYTVRTLIQML